MKTKRKQRRFKVVKINEDVSIIKPNKLHMSFIPILATCLTWFLLIKLLLEGQYTDLVIFASVMFAFFPTIPLILFLISPDTVRIDLRERILEKTSLKGISIQKIKILFKTIKKLKGGASFPDLDRTGGELDPIYSVIVELDDAVDVVLFQDSCCDAVSDFRSLIEQSLERACLDCARSF